MSWDDSCQIASWLPPTIAKAVMITGDSHQVNQVSLTWMTSFTGSPHFEVLFIRAEQV